MSRTHTGFAVAPWIALLAIATAAFGFVPSPGREFEVPGPYDWVAPESKELTSERGEDATLDAFQARYGGTWRMIRNEATGTPSAVYGSGIPLAADANIADGVEAEALARSFIDANPELFGVSNTDLVLGDAVFGLNKWGVNFYQVYNGVRIERSKVTLVFHVSGRLYAIMNETYPNVDLPAVPSVSVESAIATAKSGLGFQVGRDSDEGVAASIVPLFENGRMVLHLTHRVDLKTAEPYGLWSTYVDAFDGSIVWRRNAYENFVPGGAVTIGATITGTVTGTVPDFNPCDGDFNRAFRNERVKEVNVANSVPSDSTTGAFALTVPDSTPRLVGIFLVGTNPVNWCRVVNINGPEAADTVLASPTAPATFFWDDTNSRKDERAVWVHTNRTHDFVKKIDPTFTGMDFQAVMNVNNSSGQANCPGNAQWTGTGGDFCAAGGGAQNTGEIGDVVYHEYGHGVNSTVYSPFGFSGAMSEGNADVIANLINEDPIIGDHFNGNCGVGIRNSNNSLVLADTTTNSEIHERGQIIAGFWWQLRGRLIETHSALAKSASPENQGKHLTHELWHWCRRLMKPNNEISMVLNTFVVDDDDGNLNNGTPNYQDICDIAIQKGFACPSITQGVAISHAGVTSTTDTTATRTVNATVTSLSGGINPSTVQLNYRVNGGSFTNVGMTNGGGGNYSATIPAQSMPSVVDYYLTAQDSAGQTGFSPTAAQDATPDTSDAASPTTYPRYHSYDVCKIYDACESATGWTPHATGSTATGGVWQHGTPSVNESQPGYDMTPDTGVNCFATGIASGNVNNGITILLSPVWDLTDCDSVVAKMRRWFVNDQDGTLDRFRRDYCFTDVSNDSGQTWTNVETTNEGVDSWQVREYNLSNLFGSVAKVQFRFTVQDTGTQTRVEALVDEIRISAAMPVGTSVSDGSDVAGGLPARFALHANLPNPFNPKTIIRYDLPRASTVDLAVYNASGQRVATLASGRVPAGGHAVAWDGRNDRGEDVGSGLYLYKLTTPEFAQTRKMMLVK